MTDSVAAAVAPNGSAVVGVGGRKGSEFTASSSSKDPSFWRRKANSALQGSNCQSSAHSSSKKILLLQKREQRLQRSREEKSRREREGEGERSS